MATNNVKVGDLIRFLNAVGGGRVVRITRDTAWVEDEDGFEIPTSLTDCVVVEERDTFMPAYKPPVIAKKKEPTAQSHADKVAAIEAYRTAVTPPVMPADMRSLEPKSTKAPHTYLPATGEVSLYLAYLPMDEKRLGNTNYEAYLINDSKYTLFYTLSNREGIKWHLRSHGTLLPEEQVFLEEFAPSDLNEMERLNIQVIAFAENPGIYQGTYSVELRLDARRFFKLHSFEGNDFFEDKALIFPVVERGVGAEPAQTIDAQALAEAMQGVRSKTEDSPKVHSTTRPQRVDEPQIVDLHIEALLDTTLGMSSIDILQYQIRKFHEVMQANLPHRGRRIIFIHGKGYGVLRSKLIGELKHKYKGCRHQDASFREYSYGATQVTIG